MQLAEQAEAFCVHHRSHHRSPKDILDCIAEKCKRMSIYDLMVTTLSCWAYPSPPTYLITRGSTTYDATLAA